MQVKDILKKVCKILGKKELVTTQYFSVSGRENTQDELDDLGDMLECLNDITGEIATNYLPILKQKEVSLSSGEIDVFSIDENILSIVKVKSVYGNVIPYKYYENKLQCFLNKAVIEYKVHPTMLTLSGSAETFGGRITLNALAWGTLSEYYFKAGMYDDALMWENRFKNALMFLCNGKSEIIIKKRRWI